MKQFLSLIIGFGAGQGSMFAVSTWLISLGEFDKIGKIGLLLGMLSLFQWIADWGGVYLLSERQRLGTINIFFNKFMTARLLLSTIIGGVIFFCSFFIDVDDIYKNAMLFAIIIMIIWSFNLTGAIDGAGLNKSAGLFSGLSWIFASLTVCLRQLNDFYYAAIAASFSFGALVTVLTQFYFYRKYNSGLTFNRMQVDMLTFKLLLKFNFLYAIGQCYGRGLLILVDKFTGASVAGVFVYAKQVSNAVGQIVIFMRRIEYPNVVQLVKEGKQISIMAILRAQKFGLAICIFSFIFSIIISEVFGNIVLLRKYLDVTKGISMFIFVLVLWAFANSLSQALIASGRLGGQTMIVGITSIVSLFLLFMLGRDGILLIHVAVAESIMLLMQIMAAVVLLKK